MKNNYSDGQDGEGHFRQVTELWNSWCVRGVGYDKQSEIQWGVALERWVSVIVCGNKFFINGNRNGPLKKNRAGKYWSLETCYIAVAVVFALR